MKLCFIYSGNICQRSADPLFELKAVSAAVRLGHTPTLVIPRERTFKNDNFEETLQDFAISERFRLIRLPRPTVFGRGRRSFALLAAAWARTQPFDLVWSKDVYAADAASALRLRTIAEHFTLLSRRQMIATKRMISRRSFKAFVASSKAHKRLLVQEGLPGEKIVPGHNGVDLKQFESTNGTCAGPKPARELADRPIVVYAGSLYPGRGIEQMLGAARRLKQVKLICIGGRDFEVARYLNQVHDDRITNVCFLGYVPNRELPRYLSSADILLAPYTEECQAIDGMRTINYASPLKLCEYMAAGKPIIASNIGAIPEVIEHERNGLLVEPGNVSDLVRAVSRLLNDPQLAQRLGRAAREDSLAYSWEARLLRILAFAGVA